MNEASIEMRGSDASVRVRGAQEANLCAVCGSPLPERPARKDRRCCSGACRMRRRRQAGLGMQRVLPLPAVAEVQHYSEGQSATEDEDGRVSDCARALAVLQADPARWWDYDSLAIAAGVRPASVRTRISNLALAKGGRVEFERRLNARKCREIRLGRE